MNYAAGSYDVAVVGAGHAGIEAGLACARMGLRTVVFTINLDAVKAFCSSGSAFAASSFICSFIFAFSTVSASIVCFSFSKASSASPDT